MKEKRIELYSPEKMRSTKEFIGVPNRTKLEYPFDFYTVSKGTTLIKENGKYRKADRKKDYKILCEEEPKNYTDILSFEKSAWAGICQSYNIVPITLSSHFIDAKSIKYNFSFNLDKTVRDAEGELVPGSYCIMVATPLSQKDFDELISLVPIGRKKWIDAELVSMTGPIFFSLNRFLDDDKNSGVKVEIKKIAEGGAIKIEIISHNLDKKFVFVT